MSGYAAQRGTCSFANATGPGHVQPRPHGLDIMPLCPPARANEGHAPGRCSARRGMLIPAAPSLHDGGVCRGRRAGIGLRARLRCAARRGTCSLADATCPGHVQPRHRGLDMMPLCPPVRANRGHVPGPHAAARGMSSRTAHRRACPGPAQRSKGHVQPCGAPEGMSHGGRGLQRNLGPQATRFGPSAPAGVRRPPSWRPRLRA